MRSPTKKYEKIILTRTALFCCLSCGKFMGSLECLHEMQPFEIYMHPICGTCFKEKIGTVAKNIELPPNLRSN